MSPTLATKQTTSVERYRRPRGQHPRARRGVEEKSAEQLPEYLEAQEVDALIRAAPNPRARLLFLIEWRAGLRISEALAVEARDLSLDTDQPTIRVRQGKGNKARIVPMHAELHGALTSALQFSNVGQDDRLVRASRSHGRPVDKGRLRQGRGAGRRTAGTSHIESHSQALIRTSSADARDPNKLPVTLVGTLVDPDNSDLPRAGARSDG